MALRKILLRMKVPKRNKIQIGSLLPWQPFYYVMVKYFAFLARNIGETTQAHYKNR